MTQQELEVFALSGVGKPVFDHKHNIIGTTINCWVEGRKVKAKFLMNDKTFSTAIIYHDGQEEKV